MIEDYILFKERLRYTEIQTPKRIPQILHMVWVGNEDPPDTFMIYFIKWKELMPHWNIRIWRNEDITEEHFPVEILSKINSCIKGAQKCDIMKYHIIEKYGGVYMDADVIPHRSLDPIIYDLDNSDIVLCHDNNISWEYMAVGFFAAVPHHPVLKVACNVLKCAIINTPDIHMHTGPRAMGIAFSSEGYNTTIIPIHYFYANDWFDNRFGTHTYAKMW